MTLQIGLILPDVLGTYGDDGNALVLRQRARMRGIAATIHKVRLGVAVPDSLDVYCIGGGEDTAQILAAEHLSQDKGLQRAAAAGRPILAICAGFQILGTTFRAGGKDVTGLGLVDCVTTGLDVRAIGELQSTPQLPGITDTFTGFENHMGKTVLGPDAQPLGRTTRGVGNDHTGVEGARQGSVICTYMHGPALARNPQLADYLLATAMGVETTELAPLDIPAVSQLRKERLRGS